MAPEIRDPFLNTEWKIQSLTTLALSNLASLSSSNATPSAPASIRSAPVLSRSGSAKSFRITGDGSMSEALSRKRSSASHGALITHDEPRRKGSKTSLSESASNQNGSAPGRLETFTIMVNATFSNVTTTFNNDQHQQQCSSPHEFLIGMLKKHDLQTIVCPSLSMPQGYFVQPTHQNTCNYAVLCNAVRSRDIDLLRAIQMQQQQSHSDDETISINNTLYSCNKFGESILHMACRRGFTDVVEFLLTEGKTSLRIVDDYGRTPLHDACWTSTHNPALMSLLIKEAPELLLVSDKRGHSPLQYAQRIDYPTWIAYLQTHENEIVRNIRGAPPAADHHHTQEKRHNIATTTEEEELEVVRLLRKMSYPSPRCSRTSNNESYFLSNYD